VPRAAANIADVHTWSDFDAYQTAAGLTPPNQLGATGEENIAAGRTFWTPHDSGLLWSCWLQHIWTETLPIIAYEICAVSVSAAMCFTTFPTINNSAGLRIDNAGRQVICSLALIANGTAY
jgi:hypothetical protein